MQRSTTRRLFQDWVVVALCVAPGGWTLRGEWIAYITQTSADLRATLYGTLTGLAAALLGFIVTGLALLLAMPDTPRIQRLYSSGLHRKIFATYHSTAHWMGILTITSLMALITDRGVRAKAPILTMTLLLALVGAWRVAKCVMVLQRVVDLIVLDREPRQRRRIRKPPDAAKAVDDPL